MPTIHIITTVNNEQGNTIFQGTFGTATPSSVEGQAPAFTFDDTLKGIYLLDMMSDPVARKAAGVDMLADSKIAELTVSENAMPALKATLIAGLAKRWDLSYQMVSGNVSGMTRNAALMEQAMVARTTNSAIERLGFANSPLMQLQGDVTFQNAVVEWGRINAVQALGNGPMSDIRVQMGDSGLAGGRQSATNDASYAHSKATVAMSVYGDEDQAREVMAALSTLNADVLQSLQLVNDSSAVFTAEVEFSYEPRPALQATEAPVADVTQLIEVAPAAQPLQEEERASDTVGYVAATFLEGVEPLGAESTETDDSEPIVPAP